MFSQLIDAFLILVVTDAYLNIVVINCGVSHFLDFCVEFVYNIVLDFRLLQLKITENGVSLTNIFCTKSSGSKSTKILQIGSSPSRSLNKETSGGS